MVDLVLDPVGPQRLIHLHKLQEKNPHDLAAV